MKKWFTLICLSISYPAFAQVNLAGSEDHLYLIAIGMGQPVINSRAFNSWSDLNYHSRLNPSIDGNFNFSLILKSYDFGLHAGIGDPYGLAAIYAGKRLTSRQAGISSFLNLQIGTIYLEAPSVDAPLNYAPTPDQAGKHLHLIYNAAYIGLSSRNYLNKLHFTSGTGKKKVSFNSGFFFDLNDEPWSGNWRYGYYKNSGRYSHFISNSVTGIPHINSIFMNIGIFMSLGN